MQTFAFSTAGRIIFGAGTANRVAGEAAGLGRHALLVTGSSPDRVIRLRKKLSAGGVACTLYQIPHEPDVASVDAGARQARDLKCDVVIGFGGGSVMDGAKAIAALITNQSPILDYLEVVGNAMPLDRLPVPCIAVPTTAGTGSEVTRNAVIRSPQHRIKVSMRSPGMLPDLAVVDPELTLSLPPEITAATGFDALTQLLEAFVSTKANPLTDGLCREGIARCARSLKTVYHHGGDLTARTDMAIASLFSGLALANAGLGAVHGIAGPLGGMIGAPHGAVCACLLPVVFAANFEIMNRASQDNRHLERFQEVARMLTGHGQATAQDGITWLQATARELRIPPLARWGLSATDIPELAGHALRASSMRGNPVPLGQQDIENVIRLAMREET